MSRYFYSSFFLLLYLLFSFTPKRPLCPPLYLNCANTVGIKEIFNTYNQSGGEIPEVSQWWVEGAAKIIVPDKFHVKIEPRPNDEKMVTVQAKLKDGSVLRGNFPQVLPPPPKIRLLNKGKEILDTLSLDVFRSEMLVINLVPEQTFKERMPKDAQFRFLEGEVIIRKNDKIISSQNFQKYQLDLSKFPLEQNCTVEIRLKKVVRENYRGEIFNVTNIKKPSYFIYFR